MLRVLANNRSEDDLEKQGNAPRIVWEDVERREDRSHGRTTRRLSRSKSRDSISSIRSRTQSVSGIPIGFRTLSIQVSESQGRAGEPPLKNTPDGENKDYFGQLEYHTLSGKEVCDRFNVFQEQGLTLEAAATRLQRDGKNSIPSPPEHIWRKLFWYVFGGFCSILWVGVIIFCKYRPSV
jgi:sodium/potassium-transporting ATPase subunit alpha